MVTMTVSETSGVAHVALVELEPTDVDCEVCRKLLAFDDLLNTLQAIATKGWSDRCRSRPARLDARQSSGRGYRDKRNSRNRDGKRGIDGPPSLVTS
jgi:hypothetical protein